VKLQAVVPPAILTDACLAVAMVTHCHATSRVRWINAQ